jgi:putative FmdB family regulatory protein
MPTYEYLCNHPECVGEFEEFHSITFKLEECPHCEVAGRGVQPVQRLISGGSGKGIMEKSFNELRESLPGDIAKIKQRASKDEKFLANLVGETKYHKNQS